MKCSDVSMTQVLFGLQEPSYSQTFADKRGEWRVGYYFLNEEKPATYTVGMLMTQGSCRAHASPMIRVRECRRTNTVCYMYESSVGLERFNSRSYCS
jgi:hypothetical protein